MTRRDKTYLVGVRAGLLSKSHSARAWGLLAVHLQNMGGMDIPKFRDVIRAIRKATIAAKRP